MPDSHSSRFTPHAHLAQPRRAGPAVKIACDVCAHGKRKCSGDSPCERCKRLSIVCKYSKTPVPQADGEGGGSGAAASPSGLAYAPAVLARRAPPPIPLPRGVLEGRALPSGVSLPQQVGVGVRRCACVCAIRVLRC